MGISPLYSIHRYSEEIYKVVAFKGVRDPENPRVRDKEQEQHYDAKLNEAFCRAKSLVLQYALCNPWDFFFTGTLDKTKFNRYDLDEYQQKLSQFIRDKRKAYGTQVQYLLIPEHHEDGAWHIHGLLSGLPDGALRRFRRPEPWKLVNSDYLNWPDYQQKFGFCSLGPVKHPVATSFYITKYHRHYKTSVDIFSQSYEDMDVTLRRLAQNFYVVRRSLVPFCVVARRIRRKVGVDEHTKQIMDLYAMGVPIIDTRRIFAPSLWKLFNSYSRKELPQKDWPVW